MHNLALRSGPAGGDPPADGQDVETPAEARDAVRARYLSWRDAPTL